MTYTTKQLAGQADIKLGRLGRDTWTQANVRAILAEYPVEVVCHIMTDRMKFAGIFTAGRQLVDWCYAELKTR